jgi:ribulose-phosphate 3-epimerase
MARIAPSILSADFAALAQAIDAVAAETDLLHVDVMDGHFVPNLTIGPPVVKAIDRHCDMYLDCHLMMDNPGDYLEAFRQAGADSCSIHVEIGGTDKLIAQMRDIGLDVGLAVNPETPFEDFVDHLTAVDMVLLMTVHPGFGGQTFMREVVPKIRRTRQAIDDGGLDVAIEVDGGIDEDTVAIVAEAGATVFVAGSAIFGASDPLAAARRIRQAADAVLTS